MCGRYVVYSENEYEEIRNIVNEVSNKLKESNTANGEVFPTDNVPVVYSHKGKNILSAAKWGFPGFKSGGVIINARAESIIEKPMFRNVFATKRCLVPANGYFEWLSHEDKKKTKYLISIKEKKLFYMAGLYNIFADKAGIQYPAITIITTQANPDIEFIHNRMPVILKDETINDWLDTNTVELDRLQGLLIPYAAGALSYHAV